MNKQQLNIQTADFVKSKLLGEGSGYDWWHVERVWKMVKYIAQNEQVDVFYGRTCSTPS